MEPSQRKNYRIKLLREVYEYYFSNNGTALSKEIKSSEEKLAYSYLENKKYISRSASMNKQNFLITEDGIDLIESI
jgi:hypothetical protein